MTNFGRAAQGLVTMLIGAAILIWSPERAPGIPCLEICDDNNACTTDTCNPANGQCVFTPNVPCDDNNACTDDSCNPASGQCVFSPKACDDNNACTTDTCNPATGCVFTPKTACDDGNSCTNDTCNPATGCVFTPSDMCGCGTCDGTGNVAMCTSPDPAGAPGDPSCAPYLCNGTDATCPSTCNDDGDCISGDFCASGGTCIPQEALGAPCTTANMCQGGFCADGVCCESACTQSGFACSLPGRLGTCTSIASAPTLVPWALAMLTMLLSAAGIFTLLRRGRTP